MSNQNAHHSHHDSHSYHGQYDHNNSYNQRQARSQNWCRDEPSRDPRLRDHGRPDDRQSNFGQAYRRFHENGLGVYRRSSSRDTNRDRGQRGSNSASPRGRTRLGRGYESVHNAYHDRRRFNSHPQTDGWHVLDAPYKDHDDPGPQDSFPVDRRTSNPRRNPQRAKPPAGTGLRSLKQASSIMQWKKWCESMNCSDGDLVTLDKLIDFTSSAIFGGCFDGSESEHSEHSELDIDSHASRKDESVILPILKLWRDQLSLQSTLNNEDAQTAEDVLLMEVLLKDANSRLDMFLPSQEISQECPGKSGPTFASSSSSTSSPKSPAHSPKIDESVFARLYKAQVEAHRRGHKGALFDRSLVSGLKVLSDLVSRLTSQGMVYAIMSMNAPGYIEQTKQTAEEALELFMDAASFIHAAYMTGKIPVLESEPAKQEAEPQAEIAPLGNQITDQENPQQPTGHTYKMVRKRLDIRHIFTEWTRGLNGSLSIEALEGLYGKSWRVPGDKLYFSQAKRVVEEVRRLMATQGMSEVEAIAEVQTRVNSFGSLRGFLRTVKKEADERDSQPGPSNSLPTSSKAPSSPPPSLPPPPAHSSGYSHPLLPRSKCSHVRFTSNSVEASTDRQTSDTSSSTIELGHPVGRGVDPQDHFRAKSVALGTHASRCDPSITAEHLERSRHVRLTHSNSLPVASHRSASSGPVSPKPLYKLFRDASTVQDVWKEWSEGVDGQPPLRSRKDRTLGWLSAPDRDLYSDMKWIPLTIQRLSRAGMGPQDEVAKEMERKRVASKKSLREFASHMQQHRSTPDDELMATFL